MKISIPKPCNENWNEMIPEQQGAFCKVCSKVVVDFSNMTDEEVIRYFEKKKEEKTCGRFRLSQLSPYELKINLRSVAAQKSFRKIFTASLFIIFSSLFVCKSDTGEPMMFNVVAVDTIDTASLGPRPDSILITDTASLPQFNSTQIHTTTTGIISVVPKTVDEVDTTKLTGDSVVSATIVGQIVLPPTPPPMIMGKMVCTKPKQVAKSPIQKLVERKTKGEVRIMGDFKF